MAALNTLKNNAWSGSAGMSPASAGSVGPGGTSAYMTPAQPGSAYGDFADNTRGWSDKYLGGTGIKNPYDASRFKGFSDQLWGNLFGNGGGMGGANGGGFSWSNGYPDPNDPKVKGYMQNLEGGTRNMVDDMVRKSAYAGNYRGGMGVAGAADPRAAMSYGASKGIASDYANRYDQAMGYGEKFYGNAADNWRSGLGLMQSLLGNELGVQQGSANFLLGQAGIGRDLNAQELQGRTGQSQENQYYYGKQGDWAEAARNYERQQQMQKDAWGREDAVDARNWERGADERARAARDDAHGFAARQYEDYLMKKKLAKDATDQHRLETYNKQFYYGDAANMSNLAMKLASDQGWSWWNKGGQGGGGGNLETRNMDFSKNWGY